MANLNGFDANKIEPSTGFDPIPAGKYKAAITASEMKPTKKSDGSYLELELTVLEGACKDRKIWDRLCLSHPNPKAVQIARANLSAICRAVGVMKPQDSCDLHNLPLEITVKVKKTDDDLTNEVKKYAAFGQGPVSPDSTTPANQADGTPPWMGWRIRLRASRRPRLLTPAA